MYNFLNKKWFFDKVYNEQLGQFLFNFGYAVSYKIIDRGIFEILGPQGISNILSKGSFTIAKLQTGYIYHYTFIFMTEIKRPLEDKVVIKFLASMNSSLLVNEANYRVI